MIKTYVCYLALCSCMKCQQDNHLGAVPTDLLLVVSHM